MPCCENPNWHTHTQPSDPAYALLMSSYTSTPEPGVYDSDCYICTDREFAQMGLPLCRSCENCQKTGAGAGHIPADDTICTECGKEDPEYLRAMGELKATAERPAL